MSRSKPDSGLWYYHAPETNNAGMPKVHYPPPSQIPGLNGVPVDGKEALNEEREKNGKFWFKDTDTPYIRMAKMGGRKDLLVIPDSAPGSAGAPSRSNHVASRNRNTRCDWYYQLDNMAQDAAKSPTEPKSEHRFQVPEYMMHHERKPQAPPSNAGGGKAPYATFAKNVTDSIDADPTDKTRKIQEPLKQGFGRRLAKQKEMDKRSQQHNYVPAEYEYEEQPNRGMRSAPHLGQAAPPPRFEYSRPPPVEADGNNMSKLLSYGYQRDWVDEQNKWWNENEKRAIRFAEDNNIDSRDPRTIVNNKPSHGPAISGSEYSQQFAQYNNSSQARHFDAHQNATRMMQGQLAYGN